jgi:hypothetical protein
MHLKLKGNGVIPTMHLKLKGNGCLHIFLVTIPSRFSVIGLLVLNHLVSLRIVSPGYGFDHAIDGCAVGYDVYYAKELSLSLISISWLCLYQHYSG